VDPALGRIDRRIINARNPPAHQSFLLEFP